MVKKNWWRFSVLACIGCCALPFIAGATGGIAALTAVSADFWICGGVLLAGATLWYVIQRQRQSGCASTGDANCATDCGCKDNR